MTSKLIQLEDGTLVEVEVRVDEVQQISGGFAENVQATMGKMKDALLKTCRPIAESVKDLSNKVELEQVEVEVGLSFDLEGNIYITKANIAANVLVRMTLKKSGAGNE